MKVPLALVLCFFITRAVSQGDPCLLMPDPGPCEAAIPAWYFEQTTQCCCQFLWGGCDGVVPFETLESCEAAGCQINVCDSIDVTPTAMGSIEAGHLEIMVDPDYQSPFWIGYAGFALHDGNGNLLAAESAQTAANVFGFDGMTEAHLRHLNYEPGVDLLASPPPFPWELKLYEGWMAGNPEVVCQWVWTELDFPSIVPDLDVTRGNEKFEFFDAMGRPANPDSKGMLIIRSPLGRAKKVFFIE